MSSLIKDRARQSVYDAIVIGAGPNGLAAAIFLAQKGCSVLVVEARDTPGGGMRSAELTLPGFLHDICSAIHPMGYGSPFFRTLPLEKYGLEWIQPAAPLAHPLDDGTAALLECSIEATGETLGDDAERYRKLMQPLIPDWDVLCHALLNPLQLAKYPLAWAKFGFWAARSARGLTNAVFKGPRARALFAGVAAHSMLPLEQSPSAAIGLALAIAGHAVGWPLPKGGSQNIAVSLTCYFQSLGGELLTNAPVASLEDLPSSKAILCDISPKQLLAIAGERLPMGYVRKLERYKYGPGVFKLDYALDGPIPWKAPECLRAGTVHLGGAQAEIALSERQVSEGIPPESPYVLLAQQSLFDPSRAPAGKHTVWAYSHVPNGCAFDMTERIEAQIERFAPGFRDRILAKHTYTPETLQAYNANYIGGDINGGSEGWRQLFSRPVLRPIPYTTPVKGLFLCSASTPPGGGVHGMCGYYAALAALHNCLR
ncbi:MAG TPA: NAD(P)/FAD-dependent oxidoreductase [Capsulimonadaceae bacterium]|nr:NAD(P)/FAD-dependent oxidoreductase [Capsulimonadaceae bacterium]